MAAHRTVAAVEAAFEHHEHRTRAEERDNSKFLRELEDREHRRGLDALSRQRDALHESAKRLDANLEALDAEITALTRACKARSVDPRAAADRLAALRRRASEAAELYLSLADRDERIAADLADPVAYVDRLREAYAMPPIQAPW